MPIIITLKFIGKIVSVVTAPFVSLFSLWLSPLAHYIANDFIYALVLDVVIIIALILAITVVGVIVNILFARKIITFIGKILLKIPLANKIFCILRDTLKIIFSENEECNNKFMHTPIITRSIASSLQVGFSSGKGIKIDDKRLISVFIPSSPYPIQGLFILVRDDDAYINTIDEEAILKHILSCGSINYSNVSRAYEQ